MDIAKTAHRTTARSISDDRRFSIFRICRSQRSEPGDLKHEAVPYAFDLLQHDGVDLRDLPLIERKRRLARLLAKRQVISCNQHLDGDGPSGFAHVCRMGLEGTRLHKAA